ncbi:MAG: SDR family oxidoreductase [Gammaproteobacteria bacterium]|nr:SDR family oxidoreductase [Gammaproteobacteria bacterium]MDH3465138.1 SDR family oxidoreductase [Gammaproteobacteria bacterium]
MEQERTAIATGGLQGIGLAIASELTRQGMRVAVGARSGGSADRSALARSAIGDRGMVAPLDARSTDSVEAFVAAVRDSIGVVDVLVNAAGMSIHQTVSCHSDADWDTTIDINLSGPFRMIRACLPDMKTRNWGRIVNIASTAARIAAPTHAAYCASNAGLVGLTRAVAREGGAHGITYVAISPGWVETDMLRESARIMAATSGRTQAEEIAAIGASNPQNRLTQREEIAALVAFCCSDAAAGLTMEDIQVNAGALW